MRRPRDKWRGRGEPESIYLELVHPLATLDRMTAMGTLNLISVGEYLEREFISEGKHEYFGGGVYPVAEATNIHNTIASNWLVTIGSQLRGRPCQIFNSDTKVRLRQPKQTRFYYPDGMVVSRPNPANDTFQDSPVVIAEVISEATRRIDEVEKKEAYLTIPTLTAYLLIETARPRVVVHRRISRAGSLPRFMKGLTRSSCLRTLDARSHLVTHTPALTLPPQQQIQERGLTSASLSSASGFVI